MRVFLLVVVTAAVVLPYAAVSPMMSQTPRSSQAPDSDFTANPAPPPGPPPEAAPGVGGWLSSREVQLATGVLLLGVFVIAAEVYLLGRGTASADDVLKILGVTLIIVGTLFVVAAGFSGNDVAPALGLFGTLAGYLVGRRSVTGNAGGS